MRRSSTSNSSRAPSPKRTSSLLVPPWMYRNRPVRKATGFAIGSVLLVGAVAVCISIALQVLFEILPSVKAASLQSEAEAAGALIDRAGPQRPRAVSTTKEACQATVSAAAAASRSIQEPLTSDKILATVPMALGVFQGLSLYFKGWEWPPAFRRWCSYLFSYIAFDPRVLGVHTPVCHPVAASRTCVRMRGLSSGQ